MQTQDPIQYIVHLYKSDTIIESAPSIAKFLNTLIDSNGTQVAIWTPKMIRSLFGQISLAANDKREFLKNSSG
jgi:hypothetical protein